MAFQHNSHSLMACILATCADTEQQITDSGPRLTEFSIPDLHLSNCVSISLPFCALVTL